MLYLREWMAWCGYSGREMATRLRVPQSTIASAIARRSAAPGFATAAAQYLGLPPAALGLHPLDDAARPYRARALIYAARRRLRGIDARRACP